MNEKSLIALLTLLLASSVALHTQSVPQDEFVKWKNKFGFKFTAEEDSYRRLIFQRTLAKIENHNKDPSITYKMGINQFSALTDAQFQKIYLIPLDILNQDKIDNTLVATINTDINIDWTKKGIVSPVKDQGQCGSCWAFSAVAVLESWALLKKQNIILSEQQLVDCSFKYGNHGCKGGYNYKALAYVRDFGITTQTVYPYTALTQTCKFPGGQFKISNVITAKGCDNIITAVQIRPIGIPADASNWSNYASGIFSDCSKSLNHNILLVGITSTYYKIKNSWGTSWGEQGFIRLALGNTCGICNHLSTWVL